MHELALVHLGCEDLFEDVVSPFIGAGFDWYTNIEDFLMNSSEDSPMWDNGLILLKNKKPNSSVVSKSGKVFNISAPVECLNINKTLNTRGIDCFITKSFCLHISDFSYLGTNQEENFYKFVRGYLKANSEDSGVQLVTLHV